MKGVARPVVGAGVERVIPGVEDRTTWGTTLDNTDFYPLLDPSVLPILLEEEQRVK